MKKRWSGPLSHGKTQVIWVLIGEAMAPPPHTHMGKVGPYRKMLVPLWKLLLFFQFFLNTSELINNQVCTETGASLPVF